MQYILCKLKITVSGYIMIFPHKNATQSRVIQLLINFEEVTGWGAGQSLLLLISITFNTDNW